MTTPKGPSNPNSFEVALPVRQLPGGTVRVGNDPPPSSGERITIPVVPNEPKGPSPADLFWPQTTSSSDDICVDCGNLRHQGHKLDCALCKSVELYPRMASLLRELEWADTGERGFSDSDLPDTRCPICGELGYNGHSPDCRLAKLLGELP